MGNVCQGLEASFIRLILSHDDIILPHAKKHRALNNTSPSQISPLLNPATIAHKHIIIIIIIIIIIMLCHDHQLLMMYVSQSVSQSRYVL